MEFILTTFFTKGRDPQRTQNWTPDDFDKMSNFYNSITKNDLDCIIFHDNFSNSFVEKYRTEKIKFIKVDSSGLNLLDVRWPIYKKYLENDSSIKNLFCLDISDIVIQNNPFPHIQKDKIYCGDEEGINGNSNWMMHGYSCLNNLEMEKNKESYLSKKILNAGILGGNKQIVYTVICKMSDILEESNVQHATVDMCALNYVLYTYYPEKIVHGYPVNTVFNKYETENQTAWFRHK
jgi:hypothetical protein